MGAIMTSNAPADANTGNPDSYTATYTIEFVTPAFLAGADPREPEIHVPSIRGALRYWLRAAAGGVYGTSNLESIHREEAKVFGDTKRGSPIVMRVSNEPRTSTQPFPENGAPYWRWWRRYYKEGSIFTLDMNTSHYIQRDEARLFFQKAEASLWLLAHFGGLGKRARHGTGSIRVIP